VCFPHLLDTFVESILNPCKSAFVPPGPLVEPKVVPRFLAMLNSAGAETVRVEAYETSIGCEPSQCLLERYYMHEMFVGATAELCCF